MSSGARFRGFLPPDPRVEEPYRLTPQMAMRIAILGSIAIALFAVLFFRLWALQVISGDAVPAGGRRTTRCAPSASRRRAARSSTATACCSSTNAPGRPSSSGRPRCASSPRSAGRDARRLAELLGVPLGEIQAAMREHRDDPLTPVTIKQTVRDDEGALPARAPGGVPRRRASRRRSCAATSRAASPRRSSGTSARSRPSSSSSARTTATPRATGSARPGSRRAYDTLPARRAGRQPGAGRRARARDERAAVQPSARGRLLGQAHDRRRAPAGGRERARVRPPTRPRGRGVGGERRRDRRHGPGHRRDPRARVEPDLRPVGLRRPGSTAKSSRAARRPDGELPDPEPRDRRPLSARLDVQADHGARGDAGGAPRPDELDPVHREDGGRRRQAGLHELGPAEERADDAHDGARELVRHVLLRGRAALLRPAGLADPEVVAPHGLRQVATGVDVGPESDGLVPTPAWRRRHFKDRAREGSGRTATPSSSRSARATCSSRRSR